MSHDILCFTLLAVSGVSGDFGTNSSTKEAILGRSSFVSGFQSCVLSQFCCSTNRCSAFLAIKRQFSHLLELHSFKARVQLMALVTDGGNGSPTAQKNG